VPSDAERFCVLYLEASCAYRMVSHATDVCRLNQAHVGDWAKLRRQRRCRVLRSSESVHKQHLVVQDMLRISNGRMLSPLRGATVTQMGRRD
jgi:hypothetical protein